VKTFKLADVEAVGKWRAVGYVADVLQAGTIDGEQVHLSDEQFTALRARYAAPQAAERWPVWAKLVARLRSPADTGVGDTLAWIVGPVGGDAYKKWFLDTFGKSCGCEERQEKLNEIFPYEKTN
jgi:hypothetical protein